MNLNIVKFFLILLCLVQYQYAMEEQTQSSPIKFYIGTTLENGQIHNTDENKSIRNNFIQSLALKKATIFVSYSVWNDFIRKKKSVEDKLMQKYGIKKAMDQLFIDVSLCKNDSHRIFMDTEVEEEKKYSADISNTGIGFYKDDRSLQGISSLFRTYLQVLPAIAFDESEWDLFDTHEGLLCIKPKNSTFSHSTFTKIDSPLTQISRQDSYEWADHFDALLEKNNTKNRLWYFNGHGSNDIKYPNYKVLAGIPEASLKKILAYCAKHAQNSTIAIQSCYSYPQRVLNLMDRTESQKLPFRLMTASDRSCITNNPTYSSVNAFKRNRLDDKQNRDIIFRTDECIPSDVLADEIHRNQSNQSKIRAVLRQFHMKFKNYPNAAPSYSPAVLLPDETVSEGYKILTNFN